MVSKILEKLIVSEAEEDRKIQKNYLPQFEVMNKYSYYMPLIFLYPLKISENERLFVFRGYRKIPWLEMC